MLNWLAERWNDFVTFCLSILLSVWDMFIDLLCFIFEQFLEIVVEMLDTLGGVFSSFSILNYVQALPSQMINIMSLVGVSEASSIIVSAILVRVTLQLIPFVRLGS